LDLLDFCKGFLIIWIVYFHFHKGDGVGWQGVHPFIVFSGFGLTYSCLLKREKGITWKPWFLRRAERILPAYWLVCLFGSLLSIYLIFNIQKYCDLSTCFLQPATKLFLEVSFLKVFSYQTMWSLIYFDHLWFIPLIISFYVIFPFLFNFLVSNGNVTKNCTRLFVTALLVEFLYRFLSIYALDGFPVGYENSLFHIPPPEPLNRLHADFPFQLQMPFGFFPSRIGEFVLGMTGAVALIYHPQKLNAIFTSWMMGLGFLIWVIGCALLYVRLGWIAADFFIALGLVLVVINLAWICQQRFSFLFLKLSILGIWSYSMYLVHNLFRPFWNRVELHVIHFLSLLFKSTSQDLLLFYMTDVMTMTILGTAILLASWMLMKFDQSELPKSLIQNTIEKVL
jgi:peptidoglycan/LPS O-acetylase OafA/YrhL